MIAKHKSYMIDEFLNMQISKSGCNRFPVIIESSKQLLIRV
jgi:hypothetical protein